ncbi:MAG: threonine/serine exporter family protein [Tissierellia bacterium]|nr:threonine/serine exporter family protein [Tissierellia bacterium]
MKILRNEKDAKNLMNLSLYAGQLLIQNGAESYRAEDTIQRICSSVVNVTSVDAYALPSAVFVSLEYEGETYTIFRKITVSDTNMNKVDQVNSFSRDFVKYNMDILEAFEILHSIDNLPEHFILTDFAAGIASSFFTLLFGGNGQDLLCSFVIGFFLSKSLRFLSRYKLPFFIDNYIGAFIASLLAVISVRIGLGTNRDNIIIVAITNSMRDIMSGEFITGTITLTKAIFIALAIALGVGTVLSLRGVL